ncbi:MAG: sodium:alanine symporter family protein [Gammaproteobacteria bacterium]|nr:sodium:alanine symporter family protein [Pseudomonadales bacterium]MCP5345518.1 sodium:alanine symporter family protein [Pseudomonadales bacterium]
MDSINNFLLFLDGFLGSAPWFPFFLLAVGIFFTIYLKFPQIRYFRHAVKVTRGKYDTPGAVGDTNHFQALSTALSGTVGTGNIGGVALALHLGGPAALFWMWMTAFFGMTTKFVEVTLSHKYRDTTEDGTISGGPMYYMEKGLNAKWLAMIFALATVLSSFGTGNLPQINSIAAGLENTFSINPIITGAVLSVLLGLVIIGGIRRIALVASALVPSMAFIYLIGAFAVILPNMGNIIPSFLGIFSDAFTGSAASGGFLGATFAFALNRGVNRGLFSNEAGQGSAPIAHAAARTEEPVDEGMVSILEPFIDTIIICTVTGLVILSSGVWKEKHENVFQRADMVFLAGVHTDSNPQQVEELFTYLSGGDSDIGVFNGDIQVTGGVAVNTQAFTLINSRSVAEDVTYQRDGAPLTGMLSVIDGQLVDSTVEVSGRSLLHSVPLTTEAFTRGLLGDYGQYVVSIGLLLFAFSTAIAWSYYGDRAITYLFGPMAVLPYRVVYVVGFFYAAFADTTVVWNVSLITIVLMTLPNLVGILLLSREMKQTTDDYWKRFHD